MNAGRIGLIALCLAVAASGYLSLRGAATDEPRGEHSTGTETDGSAPSTHLSSSGEDDLASARPAMGDAAPSTETISALPPQLTLDELVDLLNADLGVEGEPVDREALGALLRADPELERLLRD